ncbi:MAG: hypothetical protein AB2719_13345 [Candidatus Thiodiazotropha sp.]
MKKRRTHATAGAGSGWPASSDAALAGNRISKQELKVTSERLFLYTMRFTGLLAGNSERHLKSGRIDNGIRKIC